MEEIKKVEEVRPKKEKLNPSMTNLELSIKAWWANLNQFIAIYLRGLVYVLIPVVLSLAFMLIGTLFPSSIALRGVAVFFMLAALLCAIYFLTRSYIGIVLFMKNGYNGESKKIYEETKPYFWPYLGLTILSTILIILWTLLLIIPGIIFSVLYSLAVYTFIFENKKGMDALKRSKELVKGYFWPVFGRTLLVGLVTSLFMMLLSIPGSFFDEGTIMFSAWNIITQIIAFLISPIAIIFTYDMYKDLVRIKGAK